MKRGLTSRIYAPLACVLLLLCGCAKHTAETGVMMGDPKPITRLDELQNLTQQSERKKTIQISQMRFEALRDIAMTVGAQAGLANGAKRINKMLEHNAVSLNRIFNFNALLLDHNVLPPVLTEGARTVNLHDVHTLRIADRAYRIEQQARFVTSPPQWRDYLVQAYTPPPRPDMTILPRNAKERRIWRENIAKGWREGQKQADAIFNDNISKLRHDYQGMVTYRKLLAQGIVSKPFVVKTNLGVTGGGDHMTVNDRILRITALPSLQADTHHWDPAVAK